VVVAIWAAAVVVAIWAAEVVVAIWAAEVVVAIWAAEVVVAIWADALVVANIAVVVVDAAVVVVVGGGGLTSTSKQVLLYFQNPLSHLQSQSELFVVSSKKACVSFGKFTPAAQRMQLSAVLKGEKKYMGHTTQTPVALFKKEPALHP